MAEICKNCSEEIEKNFCANCGQKKFKRIDRKYILDEIQYTVLHTNKGLFYTLKNLIKNPGKTAREFIEGNRVKHYKPLLLAFLISGISAFISYQLLHLDSITMEGVTKSSLDTTMKTSMNSKLMKDYLSFTKTYSAFIMLALVPIFALITKIVFRKWGHNYYEHLVINCYILSIYTVFIILSYFPFIFFLKVSPEILVKLSFYQFILLPIILFWFFKTFYVEKSLKSIILKTFATLGLSIGVFIILFFIVIIVLIGYVLITLGPEGLQIFKPK